jgi:transglutaminase-like putative cysteine protease
VIYDIRHVTTYSYESPVSFARCSLRLEPRSGDGQQLISHTVDIRPRPADRTIRRDFFGTHTESIQIETAHRNLRIDSRSRVEVCRRAPARTAPSPAWKSVRDVAFEATSLGPASPIGYVFASPLVPVQRPVTSYAAASFPPGAGILAGAVDLMHLRTVPPPGKPRLQGADATHAWVSLWCGEELGWVGFDPTNDILVENDHIILAVGRDFSDVSPVDGIIVGSRKQKLGVAVDVLLVE